MAKLIFKDVDTKVLEKKHTVQLSGLELSMIEILMGTTSLAYFKRVLYNGVVEDRFTYEEMQQIKKAIEEKGLYHKTFKDIKAILAEVR